MNQITLSSEFSNLEDGGSLRSLTKMLQNALPCARETFLGMKMRKAPRGRLSYGLFSFKDSVIEP